MAKRVFLSRDGPGNSFGKQAVLLENELRRRGYTVDVGDKNKLTRQTLPGGYDTYVFYTIFGTQLFFQGLPKHGRNVVFEVSDTDKVSNLAINFLAHQPIDQVVVPSRFSADAIKNSAMVNIPPVQPVRHAVDPRVFTYHGVELPHPCVLVICPHSWERKGCDLAVNAIRYAYQQGLKFHHVVTIGNPLDRRVQGLNVEVSPLPDEKYYGIMRSCDILLYPVRGGAFEIPVFEALSLGLDVIVTEKGAWADWLDKRDVYTVRVMDKKRYWFTNPYHVGYFYEPSQQDTNERLVQALKEWSPERKKERLDTVAPRYRTEFSVEKMTDEWERCL